MARAGKSGRFVATAMPDRDWWQALWPDPEGVLHARSQRCSSRGRWFAIVNRHRRPREATTVLGIRRGPRTDLRMTPEDTKRVVEPAGFRRSRAVDPLPHHYGAVFSRVEAGVR